MEKFVNALCYAAIITVLLMVATIEYHYHNGEAEAVMIACWDQVFSHIFLGWTIVFAGLYLISLYLVKRANAELQLTLKELRDELRADLEQLRAVRSAKPPIS